MEPQEEKYVSYFEDNVKENQKDVITVCQSASKAIYDKFIVRFDDPRLLASTFSVIYQTIIDTLVELQEKFQDFSINICNHLEIGFSTNDDDDDEKKGNFMVFVRNVNNNKSKDEIEGDSRDSVERAVLWNTNNATENPDVLNKIATKALTRLHDEIELNAGSSELIFPIFVTTYEYLVQYVLIRRKEEDEFEYEVNFINCFNIIARESDEDADYIDIRPTIKAKLDLKNDSGASAKYE